MKIEPTIVLEEGKYTFDIPEGDYRVHIKRYDLEDWVVIDHGAKAVLALMQEVEELRARLSSTEVPEAPYDARTVELAELFLRACAIGASCAELAEEFARAVLEQVTADQPEARLVNEVLAGGDYARAIDLAERVLPHPRVERKKEAEQQSTAPPWVYRACRLLGIRVLPKRRKFLAFDIESKDGEQPAGFTRPFIPFMDLSAQQAVSEAVLSGLSEVLEGLVRLNETLIVEGKAPLFWKSSKPFVYRPALGNEMFSDALAVQEQGFGDMPDLCAWYAASLRASGLDSAARCHLVEGGKFVRVKLSSGDTVYLTGEIVDPRSTEEQWRREQAELLQQVQGLGEALERPDEDEEPGS